nr:MAG TPA: hypothetical protein [Caudoviricetes sp.]
MFYLYTNYSIKIVVDTSIITIFTNIKGYWLSIAIDIKKYI